MNRFSQTEAREHEHTRALSVLLVVPHGAPIHTINLTSPVETTLVTAERVKANKLTLSGAIQMRDMSSAPLAETHTKGEGP